MERTLGGICYTDYIPSPDSKQEGAQAMSSWTPEEHPCFRYCLRPQEGDHPGFKKALTEDQRFAIAKTILEHLKLCRWEFSKPSEAMQ